jgi:hypothetical protein
MWLLVNQPRRAVSVYEYSKKYLGKNMEGRLTRLAVVAASEQALHLCKAVG